MSSIILQVAVLPEPTTPEIKIFSGLYSTETKKKIFLSEVSTKNIKIKRDLEFKLLNGKYS